MKPVDVRTILTVDVGNTAVKATLFRGEQPLRSESGVDYDTVAEILEAVHVDGISYCCVGEDRTRIGERLAGSGYPFVALTAETPLPIGVDYDRNALGADRLAAAVGVYDESCPVLVADAGTALTIDLVAGGRFRGGTISPGLRLRFASLHDFTSRLPLVEAGFPEPMPGVDTRSAIRAGVVGGLAAEIKDAFMRLSHDYEDIKLILTGGDASLLMQVLSAAGLDPVGDVSAVGRGLVRIFNYNNIL